MLFRSFQVHLLGDRDASGARSEARQRTKTGEAEERHALGTTVGETSRGGTQHQTIDEFAVTRAGVIATDDVEGAKLECGDLDWPADKGLLAWEKVWDIAPIVAGLLPGRRSDDEITLYESQGIGLQDVAAAALVYERAKAKGIGTPLPF